LGGENEGRNKEIVREINVPTAIENQFIKEYALQYIIFACERKK